MEKKVVKGIIDWRLIISAVLWIALIGALVYICIIFIQERTSFDAFQIPLDWYPAGTPWASTVRSIKEGINDGTITQPDQLALAYNLLYKASLQTQNLKLINFSLMTFIIDQTPTTDPKTAWTTRSNSLDLAYSYMFITIIIAFISLALQLIIAVGNIVENHRVKKFSLATTYDTSKVSLLAFKLKTYSSIIYNLTLVFAFFNFLTTITVICYIFIATLINSVVKLYAAKGLNPIASDSYRSEATYLFCIMLFQNVYTIVKAYFLGSWGVNLDLIMSIILPIGTVTVIIGLFIKNMLTSKVSSLLAAVKGIDNKVTSFQTFYFANKKTCLNSYEFVASLPKYIKCKVEQKIPPKQIAPAIEKLIDATHFIDQTKHNSTQQKCFLKYLLFYEVNNDDQMDELINNAKKVANYYEGKK